MANTSRPRKRRRIILTGFSLVIGVSILGVIIYLYSNYEAIIKDKLEGVLPETVSVEFGSLAMSPFNGSAQLENVTILMGPDQHTRNYHSLHINKVSANGIGIMSLLTRDRLTLDNLTIEGGNLVLNKMLLTDTTARNAPGFKKTKGGKLDRMTIGSLHIDDLGFLLKGDSVNECTFATSLKIDGIEADLSSGPLRLQDITYEIRELIFDSIVFVPQDGMYRYAAGRIEYQDEQLAIDSFTVQSRYPRFKFAHLTGKQTDVFDLRIDSVSLQDFLLTGLRDSTFEAAAIEVHGATLHIFRDRRMPFIKDHLEPLPVNLFQELPYAVRIGSLDIKNTNIVYEEFPEEGDKSGSIAFRNVDAHFGTIDNRVDTFNHFIDLTVRADFMESGILKAKFAFPMNPRNLYYAEGTLSNLALTDLNPTLENLAKVRIESGKMRSMSFNFDYSNDASNGSVLLLYEDLEMTALKEKESKTVVDKLKSFFLNVLFAKKNKKDEVRMAKRNGTIQFERDKKRSIFNYWWKSLATGIKSSHSINGILDGP